MPSAGTTGDADRAVPARITLVESIPEGLTYSSAVPSHPSTFQTWLELIGGAQSSLDIASFYWTLTNADSHTREPSAQQVSGGRDPTPAWSSD